MNIKCGPRVPRAYHVSGEEAEGGALLEVVGLVLHNGVLVHLAKSEIFQSIIRCLLTNPDPPSVLVRD